MRAVARLQPQVAAEKLCDLVRVRVRVAQLLCVAERGGRTRDQRVCRWVVCPRFEGRSVTLSEALATGHGWCGARCAWLGLGLGLGLGFGLGLGSGLGLGLEGWGSG